MLQTAIVTFYVPAIRPWLLPKLRRYFASPENSDVLALGLIDLTLSMGAVYLSGGWGSPYYHFALTALLIPSFFLTFRGVVALVGRVHGGVHVRRDVRSARGCTGAGRTRTSTASSAR